MINFYSVQKRIDDFNISMKKLLDQKKWEDCKHKKNKVRVKNFKNRVEEFVLNVYENPSKYDYTLIKNEKKLIEFPRHNRCPKFSFNPYKPEKERIKESLLQNTIFEPIPLGNSIYKHEFRERNRSKEIASDMVFFNDKKNLKKSSTNSCLINKTERKHESIPYKSACSMLMKVGSMKNVSNDIQMRLINIDNASESRRSKIESRYNRRMTRNMIFKTNYELPKTNKFQIPIPPQNDFSKVTMKVYKNRKLN